jgi:hypothetical protein
MPDLWEEICKDRTWLRACCELIKQQPPSGSREIAKKLKIVDIENFLEKISRMIPNFVHLVAKKYHIVFT